MGKAKPPLLSDAEVTRLYEEIFEEPVSVEILLDILAATPRPVRANGEWVMDLRMWNRIRRLKSTTGSYFYPFSDRPADQVEMLYGLPVVIEPLAKLAIRQGSTGGQDG